MKKDGLLYYTIKGCDHCVTRGTSSLRWFVEHRGFIEKEKVLQQASQCIYCGDISWSDVEVVEK